MPSKVTKEKWANIRGLKGKYLISNLGRVLSRARRTKEKILKPVLNNDGYYKVTLCYGKGKTKDKKISRLVAVAFVPNPYNKWEVNHKDGDKLNNHFRNLEWVTDLEQTRHASRMGLLRPPLGSKHGGSKLTERDVRKMRLLYKTGKYTQSFFVRKHRICSAQIHCILTNKAWRHI